MTRNGFDGGGSVPRVVVTHRVHPEVLDLLSEHCDVVANQAADLLPADELRARASGAHGLLVFMPDRVDEPLLQASPQLRVVAGALKGYDNLDVEACTRRGVWVTIAEDLLSGPTAELAVGLLVGLMRRIREGDAFVRSGEFRGWRPELYGAGLAGATVGIIGMGGVGQAVAQRLAGFEATVVYHDPRPLPADTARALWASPVPLDVLLAGSDAVLTLVHLKADTYHMIDRATLAAMKPGAFLVNVGRGSVVDEEAVAEALRSGRLAGYAADVFEMEDRAVPGGPPDGIPTALLSERRTLFTPHLGSAVAATRRQIELAAARSILQALDGRTPDGAVNDVSAGRRFTPRLARS
jgi:phosphonate dehydrogenase